MTETNRRKTKMHIALAALLVILLSFCGCDNKYSSHYTAIVLITNSSSHSAYMKFGTFTGTNVFKLRVQDGDSIEYSGNIKDGSLTVYYDYEGNKEELFTLEGEQEIEDVTKELPKGTTYIIVETDGKVEEGELHFDVK